MIKVTRTGVDIKVEYINDFNQSEGTATAFCKSVDDAKELVSTIKRAIELDYGFAKCRALLEGDTLNTHGGARPGAGRPATGAKRPRAIRLDDDEYDQVKEFLKKIRSK